MRPWRSIRTTPRPTSSGPWPCIDRPRRNLRFSEFRVAIEKNPKHVLAHNNLAEVLRLNRRYDEALVECRTALELNPELPEGHRTMANILLAKNDLDGAMEHFQIALKLKPDDPLVHDGLAIVLWRQGKFRGGRGAP